MAVAGFGWAGVSAVPGTVAYYADTETAEANAFQTGLLDFELELLEDFEPKVSKHAQAHRAVSIRDTQSIPFRYQAYAANFEGLLCDELGFAAFLEGKEKYAGPVKNFKAGDFAFGNAEQWHFVASLPESNNAQDGMQCAFYLVFSGWQVPFPGIFSGFYDTEQAASLITAEVVAPRGDDDDDEKKEKENKEEKGAKEDKGPKTEKTSEELEEKHNEEENIEQEEEQEEQVQGESTVSQEELEGEGVEDKKIGQGEEDGT